MSEQSSTFVNAISAEIELITDGIKRQFLGYGPELMAVKIWFEEGAIGYEHQHPHTQVCYVESGEFEATIGGETQTIGAGDSFYVAPNKLHGSVCKKAGVMIEMFSPLRQDFLTGE